MKNNNQITFFEKGLNVEPTEKEKKQIELLHKYIEKNPKTNIWQCYFELKNGLNQVKQVVVRCPEKKDIEIIVPRLELFQKYFDIGEFKKIVKEVKSNWDKNKKPEDPPDWLNRIPFSTDVGLEDSGDLLIKKKTENIKYSEMVEHCMHCGKKHLPGECDLDKDLD
ncbi:MAG: hypothetical protein ABIA91_01415 [Patescibacteria group bacterium]